MRVLCLLIALLVSFAPLARGEASAPAAAETAASAAQPAAASTGAHPAPPKGPTPEDEADAKIGKRASEEVDKQYGDRILKNSPDLPRILKIIKQLKPYTEKPYQTYHVKVIATPEINAFALPGGYLYFTQGLLDAVESDDELAAVIGHEMGHVCLNHARKQMKRDKRYRKVLTPVIIASILANSDAVDPGQIATMGSLVVQDALNHYGREAEFQADYASVRYLYASKIYQPVAVLTVVEGLAHLEATRPQVEAGVFQTHPKPEERVAAVERELKALGVPIERRRVLKSISATAETITKDKRKIGEVRIGDHVLVQPAVTWKGISPAARAQHTAEALNRMLLANLQLMEISTTEKDGAASIIARGEVLLTILPGDAEFHKTTVKALSDQAMGALRAAFQEEKLKRFY